MGRYRAYRDYQGVPSDWLGEIPSHWQTRRLGALFSRKKKTGFTDEELLSVYRDYGVIPKASREDNFNKPSDDLSPYQLVEPGDLVLNKMKTWQGSIAVSEYRGIVSPAYFTYRPEKHVYGTVLCPKYVHYLVRSPVYITQYLRLSKGIRVNQWDLDPDTFKTLELVIPPHDEQEVISAFLDHETAKIDRLIARQERLIELLKEKRQAVISHAVTKGLNPNAPMKDSGVEWLGEVPAHWIVCKFSHHIAFQEGPGIMADDFRDSGVPLLRIHNIKPGFIELERCNFLDPEKVRIRWSHFRLEKGDLVISASATTGIVSEVGDEAVGAIPYTGLIRLNPRTQVICQQFIKNLVVSGLFTTQIDLLIAGATIGHFGPTHLRQMVIALPPAEEQERIVDYIAHECSLIDKTIAKCAEAVTLQNEHRTALISAAVTGKIDVRGWQKPNTEPKETATAVSA